MATVSRLTSNESKLILDDPRFDRSQYAFRNVSEMACSCIDYIEINQITIKQLFDCNLFEGRHEHIFVWLR